jgi:hypothetical protein
VLAAVGACYSPTIQTGAPCNKDEPCPRPLVCATATDTCERADIDASIGGDDAGDDQPPDAFVPPIDAPPIAGCTPMGFDTCGDGIDQDCDGADEICAVNDLAPDAIDVTMGGMLSGDLNLARDNAPQKGCGNDGGRDLFYKVTLGEPQVFYFDTFGSNFTTTVRVFPGKACTAITANDMPSCSAGACGGGQSQLAAELPSGTSCIVVDQGAGQPQGAMALKVTPGGHFGDPLGTGPLTLTGNTCTSKDVWRGSCGGPGGKEDAYFFTVCPGVTEHVNATTCADPTLTYFDTVLFLKKAGSPQMGFGTCSDDAHACDPRPDRPDHADGSILSGTSAAGPGLFFLVVDGYDDQDCGVYSAHVTVQ